MASRTPVAFRYSDVDRIVNPWGLLLRSGFWYLIGFDQGRGARRTYRIDRIDGAVTAQPEPGSFERPDDFDPRDAFPDDPKLIGADPAVPDARVTIDAVRAGHAERELGSERVVERRDDGSIVVTVPCANQPAFRSWVLGYLDHAEVLEPASARDDVIAWLEAIVA